MKFIRFICNAGNPSTMQNIRVPDFVQNVTKVFKWSQKVKVLSPSPKLQQCSKLSNGNCFLLAPTGALCVTMVHCRSAATLSNATQQTNNGEEGSTKCHNPFAAQSQKEQFTQSHVYLQVIHLIFS